LGRASTARSLGETPVAWFRRLADRITCSVCRYLTLLGKGADDRCDCRADDEVGRQRDA